MFPLIFKSNMNMLKFNDSSAAVSSSLGGAKNYLYQGYFVPLEINKVLFNNETIAFLLHQ
jgi:hypothetical protein